MSMARLWRDQGKPDEARELLAPVYGWFTEGFDTLDLQGRSGTPGSAGEQPGHFVLGQVLANPMLGDLRRAYAAKGIKSDYVFVNERGEPFGRMGIARKIEHAGEAAGSSVSSG
jgi:hypothetical protein